MDPDMIANEMQRGSRRLGDRDRAGLGRCYERVLNLTDLTVTAQGKATLRRELLRWRDLVAALYVAPGSGSHHMSTYR